MKRRSFLRGLFAGGLATGASALLPAAPVTPPETRPDGPRRTELNAAGDWVDNATGRAYNAAGVCLEPSHDTGPHLAQPEAGELRLRHQREYARLKRTGQRLSEAVRVGGQRRPGA